VGVARRRLGRALVADTLRAQVPRLVVLGAGPAQLGALRAARRHGVQTIVCDRAPDALAIRLGLADVFEQVSTFDVDGVERVARAHEADGLISPGTDGPVRVAAEVAERMGLAHPLSLAVAVSATDKRAQRAAFAAAGVPQPALIPVDEPFSRPVVVKPSLAQGQRGLTRVQRADELAPALEHAREQSRDGEALVEELVPGDEVTVNAFLHDGFHAIAVTDRERASAFGVATAHLFPARSGTAESIVAARAACAALGIERGPVYVQIVLGPDGPRVMEVAARLGGGHDAEVCLAATGIDLALLAVHAALDERIAPSELWRSRQRGAIVRFLVGKPGELVEVEGIEEALAIPGVLDVQSYRQPGDRLSALAVGADRVGFVLAEGVDRAEAERAAARASELVRFRTRQAA
jgi:biotin carboxylase